MSSFQSGYVALLGQPNAGKSSLINYLVGEKVAIVSDKPQTTRQRVLGLLHAENLQAVLVDPPGLVAGASGLNKILREEARKAMEEADLVIALFNLDERSFSRLEEVMQRAHESKKPWMALITKTDLGLEHRQSILREKLKSYGVPVAVAALPDDAEKAKSAIIGWLRSQLPYSPAPLFDLDLYTPQSLREMVAEIVREQCFELLYEEIPYGVAAVARSFKESDSSAEISVEIWLAKESHKPILIGREGRQIKQIIKRSRSAIEKLLGKPIVLDVEVKIRDRWMQDPLRLKEVGLLRD